MAGLPPVADISSSRFGGKTMIVEEVVTVDNAAAYRIPNNPNRVRLMLNNEGTYDCRVSNDPLISGSYGWLLVQNGGVISYDWSEDGEGVTYEVFMIAIGAGTKVRIREVIRL